MDFATLRYLLTHATTETWYFFGMCAIVLCLIPVFVLLTLEKLLRGSLWVAALLRAWGRLARTGLLLLGLGLCLASLYFLGRLAVLGPAAVIGTRVEDWLVRIPFFFMLGAPPALFASGVVRGLLARRHRRLLAAALAEAAQGTALTVVPIDYPLVTLGLREDPDEARGLVHLPADLRGLVTRRASAGRVAAVLRGTLAGRETLVYEYSYWPQPRGGRYNFDVEHRVTAAAVRKDFPSFRYLDLIPSILDPKDEEYPPGSPQAFFGRDWSLKDDGTWVVFETERPLTDAARFRALIQILVALPTGA